MFNILKGAWQEIFYLWFFKVYIAVRQISLIHGPYGEVGAVRKQTEPLLLPDSPLASIDH
jgi:hypothetical protein